MEKTISSSLKSECTNCFQQGHAGSETLLQQNRRVLNWGCRLTQVDLHNDRKMVVVSYLRLAKFLLFVLSVFAASSQNGNIKMIVKL